MLYKIEDQIDRDTLLDSWLHGLLKRIFGSFNNIGKPVVLGIRVGIGGVKLNFAFCLKIKAQVRLLIYHVFFRFI